MSQLKQRLLLSKPLFAELLISSFFINVLALASSIFVIQVLSRYIVSGVTGTLITLTFGVLIAVLLEFCFRMLRAKIAASMTNCVDRQLAQKTFKVMAHAKQSQLDRLPKGLRQELMRDLDKIQQAYRSSNLTALLDVPFSGLFIFVIALLNVGLAAIAVVGICLTLLVGWYSLHVSRASQTRITESAVTKNSVLYSVINSADTVRSFNAQGFVGEAWHNISERLRSLTGWMEHRQHYIQTLTQTVTVLTTVALIAVGAKLVVAGELDVSALIGVNILGARSIAPFSRFAQMISALFDAERAEKRLTDFHKLSCELQEGMALKKYSGTIGFNDLGFAYPGSTLPLFESLSLVVPAGSLVMVTGPNGSGKSTLARLLLGLLEPTRGQILVEKTDLRQMAIAWWRSQLCYLPQQIALLNGTVQQNIALNNTKLTGEQLNQLIRLTDLRDFIDSSQQGLGTPLKDGGLSLADGIRKRIGLARALATGGQLAILDEPFGTLDDQGIAAVERLVAFLLKQGRTVVVLGNDKQFIEQANFVIDLGAKPIPKIDKRVSKPGLEMDGE